MSLLRSSVARPAIRLAARPTTAARPVALPRFPAVGRQSVRSYAGAAPAASPVHTHTPMWIVLGVLVAGGTAGYVYTKPIRELAEKAHSAIDTAKAGGEQASGLTSQVASLAGLGPALAISQTLYNKIQEHGGVSEFVTGLSDDLKNQNIEGALEKIKKVGGKDVEPYIKQVESALKEAKGKIQDVDWKNLLGSIEEHVGDEWKGILSYVQKAIPASGPAALALASGDWTSITKKIKEEGGDQLKELEATAKKLMDKAQEINKDKKGNLEDFVKQLKEVDSDDLDKIVEQVKGVAKKAGIPADQIESWLASKGGKLDTEALIKQAKSLVEAGQDKVEDASKLVNPDKVVGTIKTFSPALASLFALTLSQAGAKLGGEGQSAAKDGKAQFEATKKQIETLTSTLKTASGGLSEDLQKRVTNLSSALQKTLDEAPSVESTANAAKDSAKKGEKTSSAESKQQDWEAAVKKMKDQVKKEVEGLYKDIQKEVGEGKKGEGLKKALDLAKGFMG